MLIATLAAVAALPAGASAQSPLDEEDAVVVDVVADAPDPRAASAWRTTLGTWRLRLRGEELAQGLLDVPGVQLRRLGGEGSATTVGLRGASAQQVLVLLDGVPLNPTRGGGVDLALIPAGLVERVEVYRGGSGARFGSGALGGAIQIVTARPSDAVRGTAHGGSGSFGGARLGGGVTGPLGTDALRGFVSVDGLATDGDFPFVDGQGTAHVRRNADARRLGTVTRLELGDERLQVGLTHFGALLDRGSPGPSEFQERLSEARRLELSSVTALTVERSSLAEGERWALDGTARVGHRWGLDRYRNPTRLLQSAVPFETDHTEQDVSGFGGLSLWTLGGHAAHATLDASHAQLDRHQRVGLDAFADETFSRTTLAPAFCLDLEATTGLRLLGALRGEWQTDGTGQGRQQVSPSAGLVATAGGGFEVLANVARTWRAPSLDELYLRAELVEGDPTLEPERGTSWDLGVRFRRRRMAFEVAVFRLALDEQILFLPISATIYRAQNTGPSTASGVEAAGEVGVMRWVSVLVGYTYTDARFGRAPFDPLPARPRHRGYGELRLGPPTLEVFGRVRYRSAVTLDNFGNLSNPALTTLDAGVSVALGQGWFVSGSASNLTDVQTAVDALQQPQPGRSFHAQLTWTGGGDADPGPGAGPAGVR